MILAPMAPGGGAKKDDRYNHFPVDPLGAGPGNGSAALGGGGGGAVASPATWIQRAVWSCCAPVFATKVTSTRPGDASE